MELVIKRNELTAEQFIELWETVWGDGPSLEQTRLAMNNTLFRLSVWDNDKLVAMSRMIGDKGLASSRSTFRDILNPNSLENRWLLLKV